MSLSINVVEFSILNSTLSHFTLIDVLFGVGMSEIIEVH